MVQCCWSPPRPGHGTWICPPATPVMVEGALYLYSTVYSSIVWYGMVSHRPPRWRWKRCAAGQGLGGPYHWAGTLIPDLKTRYSYIMRV